MLTDLSVYHIKKDRYQVSREHKMLAILTALRAQFEERLLEKAIPRKTHWFFVKWLRYYLDFCKKYDFPDAKKGSLAPFLRKLQEKKQTRVQQRQAADAVALYFDLIGGRYPTAKLPPHPKIGSGKHALRAPPELGSTDHPGQRAGMDIRHCSGLGFAQFMLKRYPPELPDQSALADSGHCCKKNALPMA